MNAQSTRVGWTRHAGPAGGLLLALAVVLLLVPFIAADPPPRLTKDNAQATDEGFNLANARQRVLFGEFATGDVDRSSPTAPTAPSRPPSFAPPRPSW